MDACARSLAIGHNFIILMAIRNCCTSVNWYRNGYWLQLDKWVHAAIRRVLLCARASMTSKLSPAPNLKGRCPLTNCFALAHLRISSRILTRAANAVSAVWRFSWCERQSFVRLLIISTISICLSLIRMLGSGAYRSVFFWLPRARRHLSSLAPPFMTICECHLAVIILRVGL